MAKKKYLYIKQRVCPRCQQQFTSRGPLHCPTCDGIRKAEKRGVKCQFCGELVLSNYSVTCSSKACRVKRSAALQAERKRLGIRSVDCYCPTPEEIKAVCWAIQEKWSPDEERLRRGLTGSQLDNAVALRVFHISTTNTGALLCE